MDHGHLPFPGNLYPPDPGSLSFSYRVGVCNNPVLDAEPNLADVLVPQYISEVPPVNDLNPADCWLYFDMSRPPEYFQQLYNPGNHEFYILVKLSKASKKIVDEQVPCFYKQAGVYCMGALK